MLGVGIEIKINRKKLNRFKGRGRGRYTKIRNCVINFSVLTMKEAALETLSPLNICFFYNLKYNFSENFIRSLY